VLRFEHVRSKENVTDPLTKAIPKAMHMYLINKLAYNTMENETINQHTMETFKTQAITLMINIGGYMLLLCH
jgi:hypothetical protein